MKDQKVAVVKVKAYPIEVQFQALPQAPFQGEILKLTLRGFIADLKKMVVVVGKVYDVTFTLPTKRLPLQMKVKVIKTYDQLRGEKSGPLVDHLGEFHFLKPGELELKEIKEFLVKIKQVARDSL